MRVDYLILVGILVIVIVAFFGLEATVFAPMPREAAPTQHAEVPPEVQSETDIDLLAEEPPPSAPAETALSIPAHPLETDPATLEDYNDPVAGGIVPLINVQGREDEFLSPNFKVSDVSARDGAPYARISPRLVNTLEILTRLAEAPVFISSGYRHATLNADPSIGGALRSQHIAGRAADIWSSEKTPGELAELALSITDCNVGLGLGGTFLHLDLRGELASWVYDDAVMEETTFDHWVQTHCAPTPAAPSMSFTTAAQQAVKQAEMRAIVFEDSLIGGYRDIMAAFARTQFRAQGLGAVILDLQPHEDGDATLRERLSYVRPGSEAAKQWNLESLMYSMDMDTYYVFAIIASDGDVTMGAMSYELALSGHE